MSIEIESDDLQELENLLSEIARKGGVVVGKDDPIAIAFIFNQYLLKQTKNNQNLLIQNLKSDIEEIILKALHSSNLLIENSQNTSLRLVNEHISKSKTAISNVIGEASEEFNSKNEKSIEEIELTISETLGKMASIKNALYILSGVNIIIVLLTIFGNFIK